MQASIVDLRYRMRDILRALSRHEVITVLYRGKPRAKLVAIEEPSKKKEMEHAFFGMLSDAPGSVEETMDELRGERY